MGFFAVTWPKLVSHVKDALLWTANMPRNRFPPLSGWFKKIQFFTNFCIFDKG